MNTATYPYIGGTDSETDNFQVRYECILIAALTYPREVSIELTQNG